MTENRTSLDTLDAREVIQTIERLGERIEAHFPARNLAGVCRELRKLAEICARDAHRIARPNWGLRVLSVAGFIGVVAGLVVISIVMFGGDITRPFGTASSELEPFTIADGLDHTFNIVALALVCLIFLSQLEQRAKRRRACKTLHALRSITHVIDMHQLTKKALARDSRNAPRAGSARPSELAPEDLARYFDYCTQMLSLTGKVAALYAQNSRDPEIIAATNDIEELTTGLSRKIWQKLMILQHHVPDMTRIAALEQSTRLPPENV